MAQDLPARRPLFRQEVIAFQQQDRQWGRVVPMQPMRSGSRSGSSSARPRRSSSSFSWRITPARRPWSATSCPPPARRGFSATAGHHQRPLCRARPGRRGRPAPAGGHDHPDRDQWGGRQRLGPGQPDAAEGRAQPPDRLGRAPHRLRAGPPERADAEPRCRAGLSHLAGQCAAGAHQAGRGDRRLGRPVGAARPGLRTGSAAPGGGAARAASGAECAGPAGGRAAEPAHRDPLQP